MLPDREKLINDNLNLVPYIYNFNKGTFSNFPDLKDDFLSAGRIGLVKAVNTFENNGCKFSTYAGICILNEMRMLLRCEIKHFSREITESATITKGKDGKEVSIMEVIEGSNPILEFEDREEKNRLYNEVMEIALDRLNPRHLEFLFKRLEGKKVNDIAKEYGFSKSYVSRVINESIEKIKEEFTMDGRPKSPYAPVRSDYENITEYIIDYQRFYLLRQQGREFEFIPVYDNKRNSKF